MPTTLTDNPISPQLRPLAVPIDTLTLDPRNARQHDERGIEALKASLERFGQTKPIVVQRKGMVVRAGNATVTAALALGWTHIAANVMHMGDTLATAYAIADNRTAELASWDDSVLAGILEELKADEGLDLAVTGFDDTELATLLEQLNEPSGFRSGAEPIKVDDWRDEHSFFAVPDDVHATLSAKARLIVFFSGGVDSLATLLWVRRLYPDSHAVAVFADPGVEFPGMGAYVQDVTSQMGAELVIVKSPKEWWSWLAARGRWPSMLYRECATEFVHNPICRHVRNAYAPNETAVFTGSRATEAVRGSQKTVMSELPTLKGEGYYHYAPCFNVQKDTSQAVLDAADIPLWPGYAMGFVRTACWCCMGQKGEQACALEDNYPGLANEIRRWEKRLGPMREDLGRGTFDFDQMVAAGRKRLAKRR